MKVTRELVKWFEKEQRKYGTETELANTFWLKAEADLKDIGAKAVKTKVKHRKARR